MLKTVRVSTIAIVVLALLAFSQPTMAGDREFAEIYTECGLGAMIAPGIPAVAAVTNVTWDLGTTAISSNISSPETCAGGKEKTAAFIYDSYASLETDLASGSGAYLDTMMVITGCEPQVRQELISVLRNDFTYIVADQSYADQSRFEQAKSLYDLLYKHVNDGNFSKSCG